MTLWNHYKSKRCSKRLNLYLLILIKVFSLYYILLYFSLNIFYKMINNANNQR